MILKMIEIKKDFLLVDFVTFISVLNISWVETQEPKKPIWIQKPWREGILHLTSKNMNCAIYRTSYEGQGLNGSSSHHAVWNTCPPSPYFYFINIFFKLSFGLNYSTSSLSQPFSIRTLDIYLLNVVENSLKKNIQLFFKHFCGLPSPGDGRDERLAAIWQKIKRFFLQPEDYLRVAII